MTLDYSPNWNRVSTSTGYKVVFCPEHPKAWSTGYVYVHTIVAEQKIGRLLKEGEVVHHIDHNRLNNSPDNLEIKASQTEHFSEHKRKKTILQMTCAECGKVFERRLGQDPAKKGYKRSFCSRSCNGKSSKRA